MLRRKNPEDAYREGYDDGYQAGYVAGRLSKDVQPQAPPTPTIQTLSGETLHGFQERNDVGEQSPGEDDDSRGEDGPPVLH